MKIKKLFLFLTTKLMNINIMHVALMVRVYAHHVQLLLENIPVKITPTNKSMFTRLDMSVFSSFKLRSMCLKVVEK